ncbi:MAG: formylglycine-generating enzyme family protein [Candidatus Parabeggiatoa sp.]|nr:formylglycine-generating enzyme family protein [Candidatus Parabeggiatoa sp.]
MSLTTNLFRDQLLKKGNFGPEMIIIPAGKFQMGDIQGGHNNEKPVHEVSVKSFAMGRYPLTVAEFRQFVYATGYKTDPETGGGGYVWKDNKWQKVKNVNWRNPSFPKKAPQKENQPVVCISWNDAMAYIDWLTKQTGQKYCLPSEAQWEYAARAGTHTDYWWGKKFARFRLNCRGRGRPSRWSGKQTAPVGSFKPNPFGLYDTAGNVWEWCADAWHESYGAPTEGSVWEGDRSLFVLRGGSWNSGKTQVRSAYRSSLPRTDGYGNSGARLARIL